VREKLESESKRERARERETWTLHTLVPDLESKHMKPVTLSRQCSTVTEHACIHQGNTVPTQNDSPALRCYGGVGEEACSNEVAR
jgi:hypothetical protein